MDQIVRIKSALIKALDDARTTVAGNGQADNVIDGWKLYDKVSSIVDMIETPETIAGFEVPD